MARERGNGAALDVEPGIVARVAQGLRFAFTGRPPTAPRNAPPGIDRGIDAGSWFGPLEPLAPIAPADVAGRRFDYPSGYNVVTQPRPYEPITFAQLRGLADSYDLLRLVIETRKDQIARLAWTIRPRRPAGPAGAGAIDPRAAAIMDFLATPDREHGWDSWLRILLEDLLVIDAPTLYLRLDNAGRLYALDPVDGATIKRVIDDAGRTPLPPAPAYQQILKGLPAVDYTADELLYLPRNPRSNRVYGFSPVEQIVMTVNIALRRQLHQLQYYTEGTVPEALIGVPESWTPDQIGQFQSYWDALLTDDTASRRHARFVPATISKSFVQTKEAALKDDYDEWLARIVCYAFSVSPQWAVKAMNRATAETAAEEADDEGLAPLLMWVKGALDRILRQCFAAPDLEFHWLEEQDEDSQAQAQVDQIYLAAGVKSINEVRAEQGLAPVAGGEAPLIATGAGIVPLAQAAKGTAPSPLVGEGRGEGAPGEGLGKRARRFAKDDGDAGDDDDDGGDDDGPGGGYNPDQPRLPAGQTGGGQWTSEGGTDATAVTHAADPDADRRMNTIQVADARNFHTASDAVPPLVSSRGDAPPIPDYKSQIVDPQDWQDFHDAMAKLDGQTAIQTFAYGQTFAAEGGMTPNSDNGRVAGTDQAMLDDAIDAKMLPSGTTLDNLTPQQVAKLYQLEAYQNFDTVHGPAALDKVDNPYAAAALYDTLFAAGASGGTTLVQKAINDVQRPLTIPVDGQMGPMTLDAFASLAQNPATLPALLDSLAYERQVWSDAHPGSIESERIEYFRFIGQR